MNDIPTLDYLDTFAHTLWFIALAYGVVIGIRKASAALTRENAAHLLRQRKRRKRDAFIGRCVLCGTPEHLYHAAQVAVFYHHGLTEGYEWHPLCADCHTIAPHGASPERAV